MREPSARGEVVRADRISFWMDTAHDASRTARAAPPAKADVVVVGEVLHRPAVEPFERVELDAEGETSRER